MFFADWGIISKTNSMGVEPWQYPIKRFDPFRMRPIRIKEQPIGKVTGRFTYISAVRAQRPMKVTQAPTSEKSPTQFVYEKIILGQDYCIPILTVNKNQEFQIYNNLFSITPRKYDFTEDSVISIINKFPAMVRYDESDSGIPNLAQGLCLVAFPTIHYTRLLDMPNDAIADLLLALQESQRLIADTTSGKIVPLVPEGRYVETITIEVFFNIGAAVGGSIEHIHGQLYADLSDTGHSITTEWAILTAQDKDLGCVSCRMIKGDIKELGGIPLPFDRLKIAENAFGVLYASFAPTANYQLKIIPRRHVKFLTEFTPEDLDALAELLRLAFFGLDYLGVPADRNIRLTQLPHGYGVETDFHCRWSIDPFDTFGGFERRGDQKVVKVFPESIATMLRQLFLQRHIITPDLYRINSAELNKHIKAKRLSQLLTD
ncbi:MAG: hypothetical protein ACE5I5_11595 [Candidatus Heimdallarchaeota archaeon]